MIDVAALSTYAFVMSITPGPNNMMVTASGANFGFRRTLPHLAGISAGFAVQTVLMCLGLGAVFAHFPELQTALAWVGAFYLVYMAARLTGAYAPGEGDAPGRAITFFQAALFQWVNPKAWLIGITIAAVFMPRNSNPYLASAAIFLVLVVINFPCISVWALFGHGLRRFLEIPSRRRLFNFAMAIALFATAVAMLPWQT